MKKSVPAKPDKDRIQRMFEERIPLLEHAATTLNGEIRDLLGDVDHIDRVKFRVKESQSFTEKACKVDSATGKWKYQAPFEEIEDQIAGRILVFFVSDIDIVMQMLVERFNRVEERMKRPADPHSFDYESYHLIFTIPLEAKTDDWQEVGELPTTFEVQIRTLFMHAWAEPQHDIGYKGGKGLSSESKRELAWAAASAWGADQVLERVRKNVEQADSDK